MTLKMSESLPSCWNPLCVVSVGNLAFVFNFNLNVRQDVLVDEVRASHKVDGGKKDVTGEQLLQNIHSSTLDH